MVNEVLPKYFSRLIHLEEFAIHINDLPDVVDKDSHVFLFADDTKVFREINSPEDSQILQNDIDNLAAWSDKWLLKFHPDKCVTMNMGSNNPNHQYHMGQHDLSKTECEKYIGVYINFQLKFDKHISNMINKANRVLAITRKTFEYQDKSTISLIFKGLVRPHLEYAAPIWNPHLEKQKEAIENVQRRATKLIPGLFHMSYPDKLKELNLPTLTYRRARGDMIQVFKLLSNNDCYDKALPNILKSCNTGLRGHKFKLFQEGANKDIKKFSFTNRVTKHWNRLPKEVVNANNLIQFEKRLDNFWKNQDILHDYKSELKYNHTDDP